MKILFLNDTSRSRNWGCQATTSCLRYLVERKWPGAQLDSVHLPKLPYRHIPQLRRWVESRFLAAGKTRDLDRFLQQMNVRVDERWFSYDLVLLNGEGSMHGKSGHLMRLLALVERLKRAGVPCISVNQSVDLASKPAALEYLQQVYAGLDAVQVREAISLQGLGEAVPCAELVPDAAFFSNRLPPDWGRKSTPAADIAPGSIAIFGSSALGPRDGATMGRLCDAVRQVRPEAPLLFLCSTKTDEALAQAMTAKLSGVQTLTEQQLGFRDLCDVLAQVEISVGGRFHPTILAALQGTVTIPLVGNTCKMNGLMALLESRGGVLSCNYSVPEYVQALEAGFAELDAEKRRLRQRCDSLADAVEQGLERAFATAG
ncbi:polysaccharide pyruvyl transferase family protein [Marinobacterium rhizophilum]|uniref:Polysaccharide pyruvyl transferase family protein n=1 Tax=Marinobacterium rhizophilum TaxID=420402 RepID=A0ABY5HEC5_9GAMM|nr:polysaccharide pyruvyl transferase family protein [Marinobacterium rhizophilum]UTW10583.1 polysaccharide pyruvyl transferase family protein [Marinobacterium rhizophilum]